MLLAAKSAFLGPIGIWETWPTRFDASFNAALTPEAYITPTVTNISADNIDSWRLKMIPVKIHQYRASVTGRFGENAYPADEVLNLKGGAGRDNGAPIKPKVVVLHNVTNVDKLAIKIAYMDKIPLLAMKLYVKEIESRLNKI